MIVLVGTRSSRAASITVTPFDITAPLDRRVPLRMPMRISPDGMNASVFPIFPIVQSLRAPAHSVHAAGCRGAHARLASPRTALDSLRWRVEGLRDGCFDRRGPMRQRDLRRGSLEHGSASGLPRQNLGI